MKLSEAIRGGSQWPDTREVYFRDQCCCAIGGAIRCMLGDSAESAVDESNLYGNAIFKARALWPELTTMKVRCPIWSAHCGHSSLESELQEDGTGDPFAMASHLFSDHHWSKKAVAMWVESEIENKLELEAARVSSGVQDTEAVQAPAVLPSPVKVVD